MLRIILELIALVIVIRYFVTEKPIHKLWNVLSNRTQSDEDPRFLEIERLEELRRIEDLRRARAINRPMIVKWIDQFNEKTKGNKICYWDFVPFESNRIEIEFLYDFNRITAELTFTDTHSCPRVKSCSYLDETGERKELPGYKIPQFTEKQYLAALMAERIDKQAYLTDVATDAQRDGEAILDILSYDGITEKEFNKQWNKRKLNAFIKMLLEDGDFKTVQQISKSQLKVTPMDIPYM